MLVYTGGEEDVLAGKNRALNHQYLGCRSSGIVELYILECRRRGEEKHTFQATDVQAVGDLMVFLLATLIVRKMT